MRTYGQYCSVAKALDLVGDRWTLLIVRELLLQGACRYSDLQYGLPGIATNLLSDRLRDLESAGIVDKRRAPSPIAATLFSLTDEGRALEPVLQALGIWGARRMVTPTGEETFRGHWFSFPVSLFLRYTEPDRPPLSIELRTTDDEPVFVECADGRVRTRRDPTMEPELVLEGPAPLMLGVIAGFLTLREARELGLQTTGRLGALRRLLPPSRGLPPAPDWSVPSDLEVPHVALAANA